jgi:Hemolysins and related proteins containing CBS domains
VPDEDNDPHMLLGEWAYEQFELLPVQGDRFVHEDLEFKVSTMRQHRIIKLTACALQGESQSAESENSDGKAEGDV